MGIHQDLVKHRHNYQLISGISESEIGELGFDLSLRDINRILLRIRDIWIGIYQDLVKHRSYYQLTTDILETEIGEIGIYHSLRDELNSF